MLLLLDEEFTGDGVCVEVLFDGGLTSDNELLIEVVSEGLIAPLTFGCNWGDFKGIGKYGFLWRRGFR